MGTRQSNNLPPGFRFHPTDGELILHYLRKKVASIPLPVNSIIADINIYKFDPWELPAKAAFGEKEWYFFSPRDRKYPNGARPNRVAASGYWKATGTDKNIVASSSSRGGVKVKEEVFGVKKALVFYKGKPPKGIKTNWIMHEYRLVDHNKPIKLKDTSMRLDDWVLCRIYKKSKQTLLSNSTTEEAATSVQENEQDEEEEQLFKDTLLPIFSNDHKNPMIPDLQNTLISQKSLSFSNLLDATDFSMLSSFLNENHSNNNPTPSPLIPSGGFNYGNLDQESEETPQNNITTTTSNSYLFHKNPSSPYMENMIRCKRQISNMDEDMSYYPSKKYKSSPFCNFPNNTNNFQDQNPQWNHFLLKQAFMNNQQLLLGGPPHLQFHG